MELAYPTRNSLEIRHLTSNGHMRRESQIRDQLAHYDILIGLPATFAEAPVLQFPAWN
jgi:hypothetical protein